MLVPPGELPLRGCLSLLRSTVILEEHHATPALHSYIDAVLSELAVEPKLYSHVAGQLRNARRAVRPVDNAGGAGLVDPKAAYKVTGNIPRIGFAGATRPFPQKRPASGAMGGSSALARLEQPSGQPTVTPTRRRIEQPSESTTAPAAGKRWNAATRSFV